MSTLKPVVIASEVKRDGKCNIKIRIGHKRKSAFIPTPYNIEPRFMLSSGQISSKYASATTLNKVLSGLLVSYNETLINLGDEVNRMTVDSIKRKMLKTNRDGESIIRYMEEFTETLKSQKRLSYAGTFNAAITQLKEVKNDLNFSDITPDFLHKFEQGLILKGKQTATIRIYINCLKAIFNYAINNNEISADLYPFRKFKVKKGIPKKGYLTAEQIRILKKLELSHERRRAFDLFLLSFYLLGINFKDLLHLTTKEIKAGRIEYMRFKTKNKKPEFISVKLIPEAEEIIEKYKGEKYLLSFLDDQKRDNKYKDIIKNTNTLLKKILKQAKIEGHISTNYARHTVGTLAYQNGILESTISEMLGHSHPGITDTYIKRDTKKIDKAQSILVKLVQIP